MSTHLSAAALMVALTLGLAACGGSGTDRAGGSAVGRPKTLTLANGLDDARDVQAFADEVRRLSHGTLLVRVKSEWRWGQVEFERGLIADVRAGKAELGWTGSRAFDRLGVHSFDALQAPFLVDSYELERRVLAGPSAARMLAGIRRLGVVDVGLLPGPLRHLATPRPIRRASDLRGLSLLTQTAAEDDRALSMLGATPSRQLAHLATLGGLDGAEGHLASIAGNHFERAAPYVTADVVLWPRPGVLFAGRRAWEHLTEGQRSVLRRAAVTAQPKALQAVVRDERIARDQLCSAGVRFVESGSRTRAALQQEMEPIYGELRRSAETADALADIERLRGTVPAAAPLACPAGARRQPDVNPAGIPSGTYTATLTRADTRELPPREHALRNARRIRFRLVVGAGHVVQHERYDASPEDIGFDGDYSIFRDRIKFVDRDGYTITARWSFEDGRLRFTDVHGPSPADRVIWGSQPWVKTS
jgi:TRAP-type C4-dicarboxylate transport system substrate-binding protein